jgi:hypothetical protein
MSELAHLNIIIDKDAFENNYEAILQQIRLELLNAERFMSEDEKIQCAFSVLKYGNFHDNNFSIMQSQLITSFDGELRTASGSLIKPQYDFFDTKLIYVKFRLKTTRGVEKISPWQDEIKIAVVSQYRIEVYPHYEIVSGFKPVFTDRNTAYHIASIYENGKVGWISLCGEILVEPKYNTIHWHETKINACTLGELGKSRWGAVDIHGVVLGEGFVYDFVDIIDNFSYKATKDGETHIIEREKFYDEID